MATSHENSVTVTSSLIKSMSYVEGSFTITSGQPSSPPPSFTQNDSTWTITINCGRSASTSVATTFNDECGGQHHEYAPSGGGGVPGSLNFCFGVNMTFVINGNQITTTVYFAQGSYLLTNNWWIGGNTVLNNGTPVLLVINNNLIQQILQMSGSNDSFTFTAVS